MKKLIALVCMITCIFGLTACGSEETLSEYEAMKVSEAENRAAEIIVPLLESYATTEDTGLNDYTAEEVEYVIAANYGIETEGYAFLGAVDSFRSGLESVGSIMAVGEAKATIDGDQIVVYVQIDGSEKDAEAEVIFSNDMFMVLESAALNPISGMGELMGNAALNTLIGMGTVFIVLILISIIISCFKVIPKIQDTFSKKKKEEVQNTGIDSGVTQIVDYEETEDLSDDLELVAVLAAAIAAYEGAASTDGFVVRSIHKVNRARR